MGSWRKRGCLPISRTKELKKSTLDKYHMFIFAKKRDKLRLGIRNEQAHFILFSVYVIFVFV